jgi:hypothetical protein
MRFYFDIFSNNEVIGKHWTILHNKKQALKKSVMAIAVKTMRPDSFPCDVRLVFYKHGRRLDTDNYSLCAKYCIDALRDKSIIPDDNSAYVRDVILQQKSVNKLSDEGADIFLIPANGAEN